MKSIIVGTAGHIDHGKTALVKALTGIDADRLEEEKRRGITIDLGFAHAELPSADGSRLRLGFVDVPGHERFVRNMLAGVGGIDLVLLVIAADESIKPQTREHLDILQLIGAKQGITVLTKSDTVDPETLDVGRLEVEEFLRGTFLETAPIIDVSSLTGAGLDTLKAAILQAAAMIQPRDAEALTRLPIDRVFTMKGFGTVVTGTLISGSIRKEQELELFPARKRVRVRGLQVHGESADTAIAGQRTALNLAGVATEDLSRGMTLAASGIFELSRVIDVELRLLSSAPRPLKNRSRVHFHAHTMETIAEIRVYGKPQIEPGEMVLARLILPQPALLLPEDHFIIRQFSPVVTIGGGRILDAVFTKRTEHLEDFLQVLAGGSVEQVLGMRISRHGAAGISIEKLVAETGLANKAIQKYIGELLDHGIIRSLGGVLIESSALDSVKRRIESDVRQFHQQNPLQPGISREQLREQQQVRVELFSACLDLLTREKKIELAGDTVRLPGRGVVMQDEEAESKKKIEDAFASAGLKVPALHDVLAGLKVDRARAQKIVTLLLRDRVLVKVSDELVFHRTALDQLRGQIVAQKTKSPKMDVARFKELTGISRKYAIPLLEYLDRERVTRRIGDVREIL
jgi:selenocysteine-specific elongation factor